MNQVILYYNFKSIENVPKFCADHRRQCQSLNLLGRVYFAENGINGDYAETDSGGNVLQPNSVTSYVVFNYTIPAGSPPTKLESLLYV